MFKEKSERISGLDLLTVVLVLIFSELVANQKELVFGLEILCGVLGKRAAKSFQWRIVGFHETINGTIVIVWCVIATEGKFHRDKSALSIER